MRDVQDIKQSMKLKPVLIFVAALMSISCIAIAGESRDASGEVVSRSYIDIDGDGVKEAVEIYLKEGRRYDDWDDPLFGHWCGHGEKWEGKFRVRVLRGGKLLFDDASPLPVEFFYAPEFTLHFADYNADGQVDFNLGQYGTCNVFYYRLFTIRPDGRVEALPVEGETLLSSDKRNSSDKIKADGKGNISATYIDDARGEVTETYSWKASGFVKMGEKVRSFEDEGVKK